MRLSLSGLETFLAKFFLPSPRTSNAVASFLRNSERATNVESDLRDTLQEAAAVSPSNGAGVVEEDPSFSLLETSALRYPDNSGGNGATIEVEPSDESFRVETSPDLDARATNPTSERRDSTFASPMNNNTPDEAVELDPQHVQILLDAARWRKRMLQLQNNTIVFSPSGEIILPEAFEIPEADEIRLVDEPDHHRGTTTNNNNDDDDDDDNTYAFHDATPFDFTCEMKLCGVYNLACYPDESRRPPAPKPLEWYTPTLLIREQRHQYFFHSPRNSW
jgi:hypothetical protein